MGFSEQNVSTNNKISDQNSQKNVFTIPPYPILSQATNSKINQGFFKYILQHDPLKPLRASADRFDHWLQNDSPCWDSIFQLQALPAY